MTIHEISLIFSLGPATAADQTRPIMVRSSITDAAQVLDLAADVLEEHIGLAARFSGIADDELNDDLLLDFGNHLARLLLPGAIGSAFDLALKQLAGSDDHLVLCLHVEDGLGAFIWSLPWELAARKDRYLLQDGQVSIVRVVDRDDSTARSPLGSFIRRIQVVEGNRRDAVGLELPASAVYDVVKCQLGSLPGIWASPPVTSFEDVGRDELGEFVNVDCVIFHGHGSPYGLSVMGESTLSATDLLDRMPYPPSYLIAAACNVGAPIPKLPAFGETLARSGVTTLACQTRLENSAVAPFINSFVTRLKEGQSFLEAYAQARSEINRSGHVLVGFCRMVIWTWDRDALMVGLQRSQLRRPVRRIGRQAARRDQYVPRRAIEKQLDKALASDTVRGVWLRGGTGSGKSTILRHLEATTSLGPEWFAPVALLNDRLLVRPDELSPAVLLERITGVLPPGGSGEERSYGSWTERWSAVKPLLESVLGVEGDGPDGRPHRLLLLLDDLDLSPELASFVTEHLKRFFSDVTVVYAAARDPWLSGSANPWQSTMLAHEVIDTAPCEADELADLANLILGSDRVSDAVPEDFAASDTFESVWTFYDRIRTTNNRSNRSATVSAPVRTEGSAPSQSSLAKPVLEIEFGGPWAMLACGGVPIFLRQNDRFLALAEAGRRPGAAAAVRVDFDAEQLVLSAQGDIALIAGGDRVQLIRVRRDGGLQRYRTVTITGASASTFLSVRQSGQFVRGVLSARGRTMEFEINAEAPSPRLQAVRERMTRPARAWTGSPDRALAVDDNGRLALLGDAAMPDTVPHDGWSDLDEARFDGVSLVAGVRSGPTGAWLHARLGIKGRPPEFAELALTGPADEVKVARQVDVGAPHLVAIRSGASVLVWDWSSLGNKTIRSEEDGCSATT